MEDNDTAKTVIAEDVEITGTIKCENNIRIDGKLNGDLNCIGDAMIGNLYYELAAMHLDLFKGDRRLLAAYLDSYGLDEAARHSLPRRAMSMALLVGAGLFAHSEERTLHANPGYAPDQVVVAPLRFPDNSSIDTTVVRMRAIAERMKRLPGVERPGIVTLGPTFDRAARSGSYCVVLDVGAIIEDVVAGEAGREAAG